MKNINDIRYDIKVPRSSSVLRGLITLDMKCSASKNDKVQLATTYMQTKRFVNMISIDILNEKKEWETLRIRDLRRLDKIVDAINNSSDDIKEITEKMEEEPKSVLTDEAEKEVENECPTEENIPLKAWISADDNIEIESEISSDGIMKCDDNEDCIDEKDTETDIECDGEDHTDIIEPVEEDVDSESEHADPVDDIPPIITISAQNNHKNNAKYNNDYRNNRNKNNNGKNNHR